MAFIGNTPTQQSFVPAVDVFSGNGSTTAFTLSRPVASVAQVQAFIENVPQSPVDAFTVSGNTITFTSAPPSGSSNIYVRYTSPITQVMQPTDGSVGTNQLAPNAVTAAKMASGAARANFGAGAVLQVVSATKTDYTTTTSTTFIDITGLSVSITPTSASSKVLINLTLGAIGNTVNAVKFNIVRDGVAIAQPDSGTNKSTLNIFPGAGTALWNSAICWLDSPASASAVTYKIQWCVDGSTGYLNRHTGNTNYNSVSSITLMEIAA